MDMHIINVYIYKYTDVMPGPAVTLPRVSKAYEEPGFKFFWVGWGG